MRVGSAADPTACSACNPASSARECRRRWRQEMNMPDMFSGGNPFSDEAPQRLAGDLLGDNAQHHVKLVFEKIGAGEHRRCRRSGRRSSNRCPNSLRRQASGWRNESGNRRCRWSIAAPAESCLDCLHARESRAATSRAQSALLGPTGITVAVKDLVMLPTRWPTSIGARGCHCRMLSAWPLRSSVRRLHGDDQSGCALSPSAR